jgi:hypothetical protein
MTYRFDHPVWRALLNEFRAALWQCGIRPARLTSAQLERR